MQIFDFEARAFAPHYARDGYVHIRRGVNPRFLEFALAQVQRSGHEDGGVAGLQFKGKKAQFLFEFPPECGWPDGIKDVVAGVTGLSRPPLTLCERHLKVYDANAPEAPAPHKDRLASEVAVGIPLEVSAGSHLVLYPRDHVEVNPFGSTDAHRRSLDEEAAPERCLAGIEPVRVDMQPGDAVLFRGSAIYHERIRAANSIVLYLKFNALRLDPLGEDPATPAERAASLHRLEASDAALMQLALGVSPRLDRVTRLYSRLEWTEILQAQVWGGKEFRISEQDLAWIRAADRKTPVASLLHRLGYRPDAAHAGLAALRRLVRLDALSLLTDAVPA